MRATNDHPKGSTWNTHHRALQTTIILAAEARAGAEAARVRSSATRASKEHDEPDSKSNTTVIVLAVLISLLVLGIGVGVGRADSFLPRSAGRAVALWNRTECLCVHMCCSCLGHRRSWLDACLLATAPHSAVYCCRKSKLSGQPSHPVAHAHVGQAEMTEMTISVPVATLATAVGMATVASPASERMKEDGPQDAAGSWERTSKDV